MPRHRLFASRGTALQGPGARNDGFSGLRPMLAVPAPSDLSAIDPGLERLDRKPAGPRYPLRSAPGTPAPTGHRQQWLQAAHCSVVHRNIGRIPHSPARSDASPGSRPAFPGTVLLSRPASRRDWGRPGRGRRRALPVAPGSARRASRTPCAASDRPATHRVAPMFHDGRASAEVPLLQPPTRRTH